MTEYIGLALIGLSIIGLAVRINYLYRKARAQRLHEAVQAFIDELVDLYDSKDDEPRA
jgi:23S rRNA maturation mini-RNase III